MRAIPKKLKNNQAVFPLPEELSLSPEIFRFSVQSDADALSALLEKHPFIKIRDVLFPQLRELIKTQHPAVSFDKETMEAALRTHLDGCPSEAYGVWVYYPWRGELVHLLDEKEFVALRTSRNQYKITPGEQALLAQKKIGVIGLSVGQSVAVTLAMERSFGELRIADFDTLDLSNMNRIRTGVFNLGLPKSVIVAREIAEIDPFLRVRCFHQGVTEENMDSFLLENGKLNVLIDECDSLDVKIRCRLKAKENGIPVVMDTSDRGMIDIERFDTTPDRPILHGLLGELSSFKQKLKDPAQRLQLSLQIGGGKDISRRLMDSLPEIGKSICTWPQLASSVALGGAVASAVCRKLVLGEPIPSGRFYVDIDKIIKK